MISSEDGPRFFAVLSKINWATLLGGITIGMVGLQLLANRPLGERLDSMQSELDLVRSGLYDVAGSRDDVAQANDLLTVLIEQRSQIDSARASLTVIDRLTADVSQSSTSAGQAETALEQLVALNDELIATREQQGEVAAAIASVRDLQSGVEDIGEGSRQARARLEEAQLALDDLDQLKQQVFEASTELEQARQTLEATIALQCDLAATDVSTHHAREAAQRLIDLKDNVNAGIDQIDSAEQNAERLIVLKDDIAGQIEGIPEAEQNVERLIAMQDQLVTDERLQFFEAASNVERLINIQAEVAAQTDGLVATITALELLGDFQNEFNTQAAGVTEMRRQLTELILLQTTIEQALRIVEPISELGNLRRLDTHEIREAARIILDQRRARLAHTEEAADVASLEATDETEADVEEEADIEETAEEIHSPEIQRPVPVPPEEL